jgi:hypothetical protein
MLFKYKIDSYLDMYTRFFDAFRIDLTGLKGQETLFKEEKGSDYVKM